MDSVAILKRAVKIIEDQLKDITSVSMVCETLDVSNNYLNRVFKKSFGYTALDYIKMRKITEGINSGVARGNIIDIAFEYGFNSHEVFLRNCKRYFNKSPGELVRLKKWSGLKKIDEKSIWFITNSDKIIKKVIILPRLVLKESKRGNVLIRNMNFRGIKSDLIWDENYTFKLIPGGTYYSFIIDRSFDNNNFFEYLKTFQPGDNNIIEYRKGSNSIYYLKKS